MMIAFVSLSSIVLAAVAGMLLEPSFLAFSYWFGLRKADVGANISPFPCQSVSCLIVMVLLFRSPACVISNRSVCVCAGDGNQVCILGIRRH